MSFSDIKTKIISKIQGVQSVGVDIFDDNAVIGYEPTNLQGIEYDPFCTVTASDNASDYGNTAENKRRYAFIVRIYLERNTRGASESESALTTIVDAMLDAFDQDFTLTGSALMVEATPSRWEYAQGTKEYRVATINIRAMVWFDTTT